MTGARLAGDAYPETGVGMPRALHDIQEQDSITEMSFLHGR